MVPVVGVTVNFVLSDVTFVIERDAVPVLLTVTLSSLLAPTRLSPKETDEGETENAGAIPVPLTETVCGEPLALSVKEIVPL